MDFLHDYERQLLLLREHCKSYETKNKHAVICQLVENEVIDQGLIQNYLQRVIGCDGDCDFVIIVLIRILYLRSSTFPSERIKMQYNEICEQISSVLSAFPFWPPKYADQTGTHPNFDDLVFWSENHLFMTLGSAVLLYQYQRRVDSKEIESRLLDKYLDIHCHPLFPGMYEVNSHVYLPYSLAALLNLYDFAEDKRIRERAELIIDHIVDQLMLTTDPFLGVPTLSASARAFNRTRLRTHDHNVNQLVNLMNEGRSPNTFSASAVTDFLLTTKWRPKETSFQMLHFEGFTGPKPISHELSDLQLIYQQTHSVAAHEKETSASSDEALDEFTPLYWSAGLITHPIMAAKTRYYQRKKLLTKNKHLWPLSYFFRSDVSFASNMEQYEHFSKGQVYTGIRLNAYKKPNQGLVLSSFQLYNPHHCGFQQLPWMANLKGIPVWSQSGLGSESLAGFGIHNTHNPAVQQQSGLLLITYLTPPTLSGLIIRNLLSSKVRFFWPLNLFDKHLVKEYKKLSSEENLKLREKRSVLSWFSQNKDNNKQYQSAILLPSFEEELILKSDQHKVWCIGQRNDIFIAVLCTKGVIIDYKNTDDAKFSSRTDGQTINITIPRLICEAKYHSWIVVVGTTKEYRDIEHFIDSRLSKIIISEETTKSRDSGIYTINVIDSENCLNYSYDLQKAEQI